jgi:hypothetical protein
MGRLSSGVGGDFSGTASSGARKVATNLFSFRRVEIAPLSALFLALFVLATTLTASPTSAAAHAKSSPKSHRTCVSASWIANHPKTVLFTESHSSLLKELAADPRVASAVAGDPSAHNIAAAEHAFGVSGLQLLARYKAQITTLVGPYVREVDCLVEHPDNRIGSANSSSSSSATRK